MDTARTSFVAELVDEAASLPSVAARVVALSSDSRCDMHELVQAILVDGAMTLRFLALANSAAFSRGQEITDLRTALVRLGLRRVRDVALLMGAHDLFPREATVAGLDATAFWRHGIAVACWSRTLARRHGVSEDDAWLAGILHGIGVAAMVRKAPEQLAAVLAHANRHGSTLAAALRSTCGCHQGELGARILTRWNLPNHLRETVEFHPLTEPDGDPADVCEGVAVLRAAVVLARAGGQGDSGDADPPPSWATAARGAGLAPEEHAALADDVAAEVTELVGIFGMAPDEATMNATANLARAPLTRLGLEGFDEALGRQDLERELASAREIQQRLLPRSLPELAGLEIAAVSRPSLQVSGDIYDFVPAAGDRTALVVADVVGKGSPAALLAAHLQATLRALAPVQSDPGALVAALNENLFQATDDEHFATLFLAVASPAGDELACVSAGHVPPLLLKCGGERAWLPPQGPPVGMLPRATYMVRPTALAPGDLLVVATDGVLEANGPAGTPLGADGLAAAAAGAGPRPDDVVRSILAAVSEVPARDRASADPVDDLTLLVVGRRS
ncbi:MAG: HDOD domain-containing protein [bacterium]|nr:HDOD domain-containing protein [bacterium]